MLLNFLATPHHGSRVLSELDFQVPLQKLLGSPQVTGELFRKQLSPCSDDLEALNRRFVVNCLGIPVISCGEQKQTILETRNRPAHDDPDPDEARLLVTIVERFSSKIANRDYSVMSDEEDWKELSTDHLGTARLDESAQLEREIIGHAQNSTKDGYVAKIRDHGKLFEEIFHDVKVKHYKFSTDMDGHQVGSRVTSLDDMSLYDFILYGPTVQEDAERDPVVADTVSVEAGKSVDMEMPHYPLQKRAARTVKQNTDLSASWTHNIRLESRPSSRASGSFRSTSPDVKHFSRRVGRPSPKSPHESASPLNTSEEDISKSNRALPRTKLRPASRTRSPLEAAHDIKVPFNWYHVPHCVSSWVPLVMSSLATHTGKPGLHKSVLRYKAWKEHHVVPPHDSFHGRFVHPHSQFLLPEQDIYQDVPWFLSSSIDEPQLVVLMPYL